MKHSIKKKIIILGAFTSLLLISASLLISMFVYRNRAYKELIQNVDRSIQEVEYNIEQEEYINFFFDVKSKINEEYEKNPDDPEFETYTEKYDYFAKKYSFIYPIDGMFGLSSYKASLQNTYYDISSTLASAVISSGGNQAFISYYDSSRKRIIFLVDSNFSINKKEETGKKLEEYNFLGSYYQRVVDDNNSDSNEDYWNYSINGKKHRVTTIDDADGNYICDIFIQYDEAPLYKSIGEFFLTELIFFLIAVVLLILLFAILAHYLLVKNVVKLTNNTKEFSNSLKENKELKVIDPEIKTKDEIALLSSSFVELETELINYINQVEKDAKEKEKINTELKIASDIQLASLPKNNLNDKNVHINALIKSAKEVGGDFYDYFYIDDAHLAICISDVSGKGVPAALFMMKAKELIKSKLMSGEGLTEVCYEVNNELLENNKQGLFITSFIGVLDLENKELTFINAGHERPFVINDKIEQLNVNSNFILGGIENFKYKTDVIKLKDGEKLFLHTDGLNESINCNNEEFGYERIKNALEENKDSRLDQILDNISKDLSKFVGNNEAFDDVTMVILELKKTKIEFTFKSPSYGIIDEVNNKINDIFSYIDKKTLSEINIIFDEMLNNYVTYEKIDNLIINICVELKDNVFYIDLENNGNEFNPLTKKDKVVDSVDVEIGGLGLQLVKKLSTDIKYERINDNNHLKIIKKI